ncbi:MAG: EAL domain-containing protein [Hylemonella sp.]|uniref:putative bifunctional diguanylate cyclase/phosphodiesterase n=1 Tax=Hylemonella sp. TaxID=2066020 RepID=UPI0022CAE44C|nr:EAL domain-containing protein [Hylemonella sp.]MCZ8253086.1 EAL domain-containing protein [Hylemonella sp.]
MIFWLLPEHASQAWGQMAMALVALVGAVLLWRRRYRLGIYWMASGVWLCIMGMSLFHEGVRTPIYYALPIVVIFLGWVVGTRAALFAVGITIAATVALIAADMLGWRPAVPPSPPLLHGIAQSFVLLLSAALVIYLVQAYRERLQEMARAHEVLRQSELKFATTFNANPVAGSIATQSEGRIVAVNDNFVRDFGWSREELEGRTAVEIGLWPDLAHRTQFREALSRQGRTMNHETVWRHRSGELRRISISSSVIELDGVSYILSFCTDITTRKAAEEEIQRLAFFDPLTGLPNRRLLMDRLDQAMTACTRHQRLGALLFIDLDNFKTLNDTHGHDMGDLLLRQVAQRLAGSVREGDTVARLGGDEFVVMLEDLSRDAIEAATQAETIGRKIVSALNELYEIRALSVHSTPSLGATLFGAEIENIEEPIKRADLAMYQAKSAGRNTIRFYDPRMQSLLLARAALERDLRAALQQDQFVLHYQPQVQRGGLVAGAEALLRWQHPQRGLVSPGEFIALSEETGLILPLGERVLELACTQLARWATQPGMAHLTLSVNVSPRQFQQEQFVDQVLAVLQRTGAPPARLKLELTESLLISNVDEVITKMDAIKARGVGFALDDFGTGYSSLSYLKRLPLDQLKIDQSFVRDILVDPNDAAIARMVIVLGESLGLEVMAEGVETLAQQQALQALGCHAYQGYLYSRPLTVEALAELARQTGWPIMTLRG